MAKDREPVKRDESESDSSEEEVDEGSESEKEADESGSESELEPESDGPSVQKSNIDAKKPISKANDPAKFTVTKQSVNDKATEINDAKKAKKKIESETVNEKAPKVDDAEKAKKETESKTAIKSNYDSKKLPFQRLWSEEDEIVILKGMIKYNKKKKLEPGADLSAFHEFIKKDLHVDVTRPQLLDKIRKLKKKYENNKSKEKDGKDRAFSKPHEQKVYELSKDIWGNDECGGEKGVGSAIANDKKAPVKKNANVVDSEEAKGSKSVMAVSDEGDKKSLGKRLNTGGLSVEERIIASGAEFFEMGRGLVGERQWKKLRVEELELHVKLQEVRIAQTKLVLDALKSEQY